MIHKFIKLRYFFVLCFVLSQTDQVRGQNNIEVSPIDTMSSRQLINYGKLVLDKPFGVAATYNIRFKGLHVQDSLKSLLKFEVDFIEDNDPRPIKSKNTPFASVVWNDERDHNDYLEISIHLPEEYFSLKQKRLNLEVDLLMEMKSKYTRDYELMKSLSLVVLIDFEQSDTLTLTQWKSGKYPGIQVVNVKQNSDFIEVKAHPKGSRQIKTYKINMLAHEKFVYHTPPGRSALTFGIMTIPLKSYRAQTYFDEMVQTSFTNFAFHIGLLNNEIHTIRADGHYHRKTIGAGLFLHPSFQTVSRLRVASPELLYLYVENPYKAPFLGFGIDLNVAVNGIKLHLIPMAFDFQLDQTGNSRAAQSHVWWFGLGIGYTPSGRFLQRN